MSRAPTAPAPPRARTLTPEERRAYDEQGFVVVEDLFPVAEIEALDREMDDVLARAGEAAPHLPSSVMQLGLRSPLVRRLVQDERILDLIGDIVQPGIAVFQAMLFAKPPHFDVVCHWHQDDAFYADAADPATHTEARLSIWTPLRDVDEHSSCLWVVPGSHKDGLQPFEVVDFDQCRRRLNPEYYDFSRAVPVPMRAGSVLIFSALTWHYSKGNQSDRVRRALVVSYQEPGKRVRNNTDEWKVLRPAG
jgi:ectoine hydroxylase-related dioxygenase (phytanoyl-CoA dioxygenase family)